MRPVLIPGYEEIIGEGRPKYEEILKNISSDIMIMLIICLNAELNSGEEHKVIQERLFLNITKRYSENNFLLILEGVSRYKEKVEDYDGTLFARRYLLVMFLKELKRNNKISIDADNSIHEFNFLIAYFLIIDEVNKDYSFLENAKEVVFPIMPTFPMLWAISINQYEMNDNSNAHFELLKLLSFCKYSYDNYKSFLKELINKNGFVNISQYMGSFYQIVKAGLKNNTDEFLRKLYFIVPSDGADYRHLESLCINQIQQDEDIYISDIKRFPLYKTENRGYMVIDEDFYKKKIYKGSLFSLRNDTSLAKGITFEDYKNDISKKCFEDILFKGIAKQLIRSKDDIFHFDNNSKLGEPDLYYRNGNNIFLIEFKDYLFPDKITKSSNFSEYEKYINERLVSSDKNRSKGVSQLAKNISNLFSLKYKFDEEVNKLIRNNEIIEIHPIIIHTDFMFSIPGLNEYLNCIFKLKLQEEKCIKIGINCVTLVNLDVLYDLALRGGDFMELLKLIKIYYNKITLKRVEYMQFRSSDSLLSSTIGFDEMYKTKFKNEMIESNKLSDNNRTKRMNSISGISDKELQEIL